MRVKLGGWLGYTSADLELSEVIVSGQHLDQEVYTIEERAPRNEVGLHVQISAEVKWNPIVKLASSGQTERIADQTRSIGRGEYLMAGVAATR